MKPVIFYFKIANNLLGKPNKFRINVIFVIQVHLGILVFDSTTALPTCLLFLGIVIAVFQLQHDKTHLFGSKPGIMEIRRDRFTENWAN